MSKQDLRKALLSVENMHEYMCSPTIQIISDIKAAIENGVTLRDQFAMAALSKFSCSGQFNEAALANFAYKTADEMLRVREKRADG